jgi:hypothetical protein
MHVSPRIRRVLDVVYGVVALTAAVATIVWAWWNEFQRGL